MNAISIKNGDILLDNFVLYKAGKEYLLTVYQYKILVCLLKKVNMVCTKNELFETINFINCDSRTINQHISNLRKIVGKERIKTIRGIGYKFVGERNNYAS